MAANNKLDSNSTGLRIAEEASLKTLPGTPVWVPHEPNSYSDFGGETITVARNPINAARSRKKGVVTDLNASGGFNTDLTQTNIQELLQGFFYADLRRKGECKNAIGETTITISATATGSKFTRVGGAVDMSAQFAVDDLVFVAGFSNSANNGLFKVSAVTATTIDVVEADGADTATTLVDEAATSNASIVQVGVESDAGDVDADISGTYPALTSTTLDFTTLGLNVGEFIFIGGDLTATKFAASNDNGWARIRSIAATKLELDKTAGTFTTEANTTLQIQIFFGRVLKNETGTSIVRRSYQLERTLGKKDTTDTYEQAEYIEGAVPNELKLDLPMADKPTVDLTFVGLDHTTKDGSVGPKSGTRPTLVDAPAFNTSSDISRIKMATFTPGTSNPAALFLFAMNLSLTIGNNVSPNKALGTLGSFDTTAGTFEVGGELEVYFTDVASIAAVRNNSDVTLDFHLVKSNAGISIDIPLVSLGDGRLGIEQDEPIKIPLTSNAAAGTGLFSDLTHTVLMSFYDYLPSAADS